MDSLQYLKMQTPSIQQQLKKITLSFILHQNQLHYKLQLFLLIIEAIAYVSILNGIHVDVFEHQKYNLVILICLCLLKCVFKISLGMGLYLLIFQQIISFNSILCHMNLIIVVILMVTDTIGCICFDVSLNNVTAESNNSNKIYHLVLFLVNVILSIHLQNYIHLASFLLFLFLFLLKGTSMIKNHQFRQISMRLYLWISLQHLRLFLVNTVHFTNSLNTIATTLIISQLLFSLYSCLKGKMNLYELSAKEQYLQLSFQVLANHFSNQYNQQIYKFRKDLINDSLQVQSNSFRQICKVLENKLRNKRGFLQSILVVQMKILNGSLFVAKKMLVQVKDKVKWHQIIHLILIYRMEYFIANQYHKESAKITIAYEQEYKDFLTFQQLIHKAALQHFKFNLYLKKAEIQLTNIKEMCAKIIKYDERIKKIYQRISEGFILSTQLYIAYLFTVQNNYQQAELILQKRSIKQKHLIDFNLHQKIYLKLKLKQDSIMINRVGFNAKTLLFYNRKQLQEQPIQRLVPTFFRKNHHNLCLKQMEQNCKQVFLYQKNTIILNNRNTYNECNLLLKLNYQSGEQFYLQGYILIIDSQKHDLNSYLFVSLNGNIIQSNHHFINLQSNFKNNNHIQQYFDQPKIGFPFVSRTQNGIETYDPLIKHNGEQPFYFYCKKIQQNQLFLKIQGKQQNMNFQHKKEKKKISAKQLEQVEGKVASKQLWILMVIFGVLLCCLFGSEYFLTVSASVKYSNQQFAVQNSRNLIRYYSYLLKLQLDLVYVDFRDNFNYSNSFMREDLVNSTLQMQSLNEYLKKYVVSKFKLNTYNPQIYYYQNNFEAIQMLLTNAYLYHKFHNDSFVKNAALDNYKLANPVIVQSSLDYRNSILSLMTFFVQTDLYYDRLSLAIALTNQLIFLFIAIRIFYKLRSIQQIVLKFRCYQTNCNKKINEILDFLKMITIETSSTQTISQEVQIYNNLSNTSSDTTFMKSQMSLIRQASGRNLMNETINNTGFIEQLAKNDKALSNQTKYLFRQGKSYRFILVSVAAFVLILLSLTITNYIINSRLKNLDELQSVTSVILLYRANGFYATRGVIPSLTTIFLKQIKNVNNIKTYTPIIQGYYATLASYTLPLFGQTQFSQFSPFAARLSNIYQRQICSYMYCDPKYQSHLSLNYITVINKLSSNLSNFVTLTLNMTNSQFMSYINTASNRLYIDLLFYSQVILTEYIVNTIMIYLQNYSSFMNNLFSSRLNYIHTMIAFTAVGLLLFLYFAYKMKEEIAMHKRIITIYQS